MPVQKQPTILIAGGAGFVGTNLARYLLNQGLKMVIIDSLVEERNPSFNALFKSPRFSFIQADLNKGIPLRTPDPTQIVHLAGLETRLYQQEKADLQSLLTNALATRNLLELSRRTGARFVLASSVEVYRGVLSSQNLDSYFGTSPKETLRFSHAEAKRFAEALVWEYYQKYDLDTVICRLGEVYGPEMNLSSSGNMGKFLTDFISGKDLTIAGEGIEKEYYTFIGDAVEGFARALFDPKASGKIYPLCPLKGITILELAYLIKSLSSRRIEICFRPKDSLPLPEIKIIDGQVQKDLGWKPKVSLKDGIRITVENLAAQKAEEEKEREKHLSKKIPAPPAPRKERSFLGIKKAVSRAKRLSFAKISKVKIALLIALMAAFWLGIIGPASLLAWHTSRGAQNLTSAEKQIKALEFEKARKEADGAKGHFQKAQKSLERIGWLTSLLGLKESTRSWDQLLSGGSYLSEALTSVGQGLEPVIAALSNLANPAVKVTIKEQESLNNFQEAQRYLLLAEAAQSGVSQTAGAANPIREALQRVPDYKRDLELLKSLSQFLPSLLGYEAPQNYLILIKDSQELSPNGGKIASFVELTLKEEKVVDLEVDDAENLGQMEEKSLFLSQNRSETSQRYEAAKGKDFQTLAAADLFFVRDLLEITGPVFVPALNETFDKDSLMEKSLFQQNSKTGQKTFLTHLGQKILEKVTAADREEGARLLVLLKSSLEKKHLTVIFGEDKLNRLFNERGWGGEFRSINGDYLYVIDENNGASKANAYVKRTINYEANLVQREASLTITYVHLGKSNSWPSGPYENLVRIVLPEPAELLSAQINREDLESRGEEVKQEIGQEVVGGRKILSANFNLKAQKSLSLKLKYRLSENVVVNNRYQLIVQKQPGTEKDSLNVSLVLPSKPQTVQPEEKLKTLGNNLNWTWDLEKDRTFEVSY